MRRIVFIIALVSASWMGIYLYGLAAESWIKYNSILVIFPTILFVIVFVCIYLEIKDIESKKE